MEKIKSINTNMYLVKNIFKVIFILMIILIVNLFNFGIFKNYSYSIDKGEGNIYNGIDVSSWQGYIDYKKVKEDGIDIVYIKASEGENFKDPYFDINYRNAKKNGLKVGVYHFLTATSTEEAREEARFFHKVIEKKQIDCKLAMDYERFYGLNKEESRKVAIAFIEELKKVTGKDVIIYSDLSNARDRFNIKELTKYPLWIAYYGDYRELEKVRLDWENWTGVQYEDNGRVSGIKGNVDRDRYAENIFLKDTSNIPEEKTKKKVKNTREVDYVVKRGDTLYDIAKKYNTRIDEIVELNNIKDRDKIYVGERLKIIENSIDKGIDKRATGKVLYTVKKRR